MDSPNDLLADLARTRGFKCDGHTQGGYRYSYGHSAFPFWLAARFEKRDELFLYGRVRTYNLAGCRTDLHDWIGVLWAACLRIQNVNSVWLLDEEGFVSSDEIYGRFLLFDQPSRGRFSVEQDKTEILRVFSASAVAAEFVTQIWCSCSIAENDEFDYDLQSIPPQLLSAFPCRTGNRNAICGRRSKRICYYRNCAADISYTDFRECPAWGELWHFFQAPIEGISGESHEAILIRSGRIRNVIWKRPQRALAKLLQKIGATSGEDIRFVPCGSHLIALTPAGVCSKRIESGAESYAREFELLRKQHMKNTRFLNQDTQFEWLPNLNPGRFEELVRDILDEVPEVCRVKHVGHCNEADGGRDIIADVRRSFLKGAFAREEDSPNQALRIIVQCKLARRNVGKASVSDIRDSVDQHNADGFLLVAFPGVTRPLLDYVEAIRAKKLFWIDCWTRADLEAQLRSNPNVALRYQDLLKVIVGQEAQ